MSAAVIAEALSGNGRRPRSRRELNNLTLRDFATSQKVVLKYNEYGTTENLEDTQLPSVNHQVRPATTIGHRAQSTIIQQSERPSLLRERPNSTRQLRVRIKHEDETNPSTSPEERNEPHGATNVDRKSVVSPAKVSVKIASADVDCSKSTNQKA